MTSIRESIKRFFTQVKPLTSGVYHYQAPPDVTPPYRLHLRLEPDGNGLLIVNASTILHLNQSAAEYAYHLIKQTPIDEIARQISGRYRVSRLRAVEDFQNLSARIQTLVETPDLDPEMYLDFERTSPHNAVLSAPYRLDCAITYRLPEGSNPSLAPNKRVIRELTTDEWINILNKAWEVGIPHVLFTGGEPTLRDDLPRLLTHAEENGQVAGLLTDGIRFTDTQYLNLLLQTGLDHVLFVLQTDNPTAWTALETVLSADLFVVVHITINPQNAMQSKANIERLSRMGAKHLSLSVADSSLHKLLHELRNHTAVLGMSLVWDLPVPYSTFNPIALEIQEESSPQGWNRSRLYVEPDGDVLPSQGINQVLGNFLTDSWEKIWQ
jgi:hypothetical protein